MSYNVVPLGGFATCTAFTDPCFSTHWHSHTLSSLKQDSIALTLATLHLSFTPPFRQAYT